MGNSVEDAIKEMAEFRAKDRRERLAMAALTGLLSTKYCNYQFPHIAVKDAVEHADALIAELDKGEK